MNKKIYLLILLFISNICQADDYFMYKAEVALSPTYSSTDYQEKYHRRIEREKQLEKTAFFTPEITEEVRLKLYTERQEFIKKNSISFDVFFLLLNQLSFEQGSLSNDNLAVLSGGIYLDLNALNNTIIMANGSKWSGKKKSRVQIVLLLNGQVEEQPKIVDKVESLSVILFTPKQVEVYDLKQLMGWYYSRPVIKKNKKNSNTTFISKLATIFRGFPSRENASLIARIDSPLTPKLVEFLETFADKNVMSFRDVLRLTNYEFFNSSRPGKSAIIMRRVVPDFDDSKNTLYLPGGNGKWSGGKKSDIEVLLAVNKKVMKPDSDVFDLNSVHVVVFNQERVTVCELKSFRCGYYTRRSKGWPPIVRAPFITHSRPAKLPPW